MAGMARGEATSTSSLLIFALPHPFSLSLPPCLPASLPFWILDLGIQGTPTTPMPRLIMTPAVGHHLCHMEF